MAHYINGSMRLLLLLSAFLTSLVGVGTIADAAPRAVVEVSARVGGQVQQSSKRVLIARSKWTHADLVYSAAATPFVSAIAAPKPRVSDRLRV